MRRFFVDIPTLQQENITLPNDESKHISKVLRMQIGDHLEIINGKGALYTGEITEISHQKVSAKCIDYKEVSPDNFHIHVAIAPTKQNDRLEWFLEKATELGIHEISLLLCDNSERKKVNLDRFKRILVAATKQSKRLYIPQLNPLIKFDDFIVQHPKGIIAHCYEEEERNSTIFCELNKHSSRWKTENIPLLIGPEGDFSIKEVKNALKNQYQTVTLGKTRLRTETAGVYACMNVKLYFDEK